jgi:hypothetical protein
MLAIHQLRLEITANLKKSNVELIIPFEVFQKVTWLLVTSTNESLIYEASWIVIDVTHKTNIYSSFLANPEVIKPLYELLEKMSVINLIKHILFIFANLMSEAHPIPQQIITNTEIAKYTLKLMEGDITLYLRDTVVWLYGELFKTHSEEYVTLACQHIPKIVAYALNPFNEDFFKESLSTLKTISAQCIKQVKEVLVKEGVVQKFEAYLSLQTDPSTLHQVIAIYINLVNNSQAILRQIDEDTKCFDKVEEMLTQLSLSSEQLNLKDNKYLFVKILHLLTTMIETNGRILNRIVRDSKIPRILSNVFIDNKLSDEIIKFFSIAMEYGSNRVKTQLIIYNVLEILCFGLNVDKTDTVKYALEGLRELLQHGAGFFEKRNIIKEQMIKMNVDYQIDQICNNNSDPEISKLSAEIMQTYFIKT